MMYSFRFCTTLLISIKSLNPQMILCALCILMLYTHSYLWNKSNFKIMLHINISLSHLQMDFILVCVFFTKNNCWKKISPLFRGYIGIVESCVHFACSTCIEEPSNNSILTIGGEEESMFQITFFKWKSSKSPIN